MRILGISGSLRSASHNTALLRAVGELLPDGIEIELYDGLAELPHYNGDDDHDAPPAAVTALRDAIAGADAILIATPEYNASVPGVLKNAVDWASRPHRESALWGKTAAVIGASPGAYGALWAQADLRKALGTAGARVLDRDLPVARAAEAFDADGRLADPALAARLREHVGALVELATPAEIAA